MAASAAAPRWPPGPPFILGFARSGPIRARLASLSGQQRRWLRDGGAIRLGECPWDSRLRLFAIGVRSPGDQRSPWVSGTNLRSVGPQKLAQLYRQRWRVEQVIDELVNGHDLDHPALLIALVSFSECVQRGGITRLKSRTERSPSRPSSRRRAHRRR